MTIPVPTKLAYPPYPKRHIAVENRVGLIGFYHVDAEWFWLGAWRVIALTRLDRREQAGDILWRIISG